MTHDELLAKLNRTTSYISERMVWGNQWHSALRAVVELHKPTRFSGELVCDACEEWTNEGASQLAYPCPTIQAIEKELS
jgi:hypothetical protein